MSTYKDRIHKNPKVGEVVLYCRRGFRYGTILEVLSSCVRLIVPKPENPRGREKNIIRVASGEIYGPPFPKSDGYLRRKGLVKLPRKRRNRGTKK